MACPITLVQAEKVIAAGRAEAGRLKSTVNAIAVADTHGELVAFIRMDDSTVHSIEFAQVKASCGAAREASRVTATPPPEMAAAPNHHGSRFRCAARWDSRSWWMGKVIGAVGVSGGDDFAIAKAAVKALH